VGVASLRQKLVAVPEEELSGVMDYGDRQIDEFMEGLDEFYDQGNDVGVIGARSDSVTYSELGGEEGPLSVAVEPILALSDSPYVSRFAQQYLSREEFDQHYSLIGFRGEWSGGQGYVFYLPQSSIGITLVWEDDRKDQDYQEAWMDEIASTDLFMQEVMSLVDDEVRAVVRIRREFGNA